MIYQFFQLLSKKKGFFFLCMKIIHSVVVEVYFGFLTTFSIGPSYIILFVLLKFHSIKERTDKVLVTIGFLTGQFIIFISIFYVPLYQVLSRPHAITVLAIPYLLFQLFQNNNFFCYYGLIPTLNSMRNLSIKYIFNNIIFQSFNLFFFPNFMFSRVVNIFMFRCNNNMLFLTSIFIGWLICFIIFMKWIELVYYGLKNCFRSRNFFFSYINLNNIHTKFTNKIFNFVAYYHSKLVKKHLSKLINILVRIFSLLFFIICVYSLVRIPLPILNQKQKETISKIEKKEKIKEYKEVKKKCVLNSQEVLTKDTFRYLFSEEMMDHKKNLVPKKNHLDKNLILTKHKYKENQTKKFIWLKFEQILVILLFNYQQWNNPLRYIKNYQLENNIRNEMSQYFFYTCPSDGKLKISFTYSYSLLTFLEIIQIKIYLSTIDILYFNLLKKKNDIWRSTNEKKKSKQSNDFLKRMDYLDKKDHFKKILKKNTRLCFNNDKKNIYLTNIYDPFTTGSCRGRMKQNSSSYNETFFIENHIIWINKIHNILLPNYQLEQKKKSETFDQKLLKIQKLHFLTFISQKEKSTLNFFCKGIFLVTEKQKNNFKYREKDFNILKKIINEFNNIKKLIRKKSIEVKTICKKVPKWSYKLIDELEQQLGEEVTKNSYDIRSRKAKRIVIYTDNYYKNYSYYNNNTLNKEPSNPDKVDEVTLLHYLQQSDFRREIIKGTIRTQRRKTVILKLFQVNMHSPIFLDRKSKIFFFEIFKKMIFIYINRISQISKLKNYRTEKERKLMKKKEQKIEEKVRIEIAEAWDTILFAQGIRGFILIIQSIFRKYIFLPFLIIVKNFFRILLFQSTEWSEDFKKCKREMHVKCTYNGIQLSENEFPKNWLTDGIQIKILFPFYLKPWNRSRLQSDLIKKKRKKEVFCFLTVWGMESELYFGSPQKRPSFFEPIFKKLQKKIINLIKKIFFIVLRVLKENKNLITHFFFNNFSNFFKIRIKNLLSKDKKLFFFGLKKNSSIISETKKEIYLNRIIQDFGKDLEKKKKIKKLIDKTNIIKNQIEDLIKKKDNKKNFITSNINIKIKKLNLNTEKKSMIKKIIKSTKKFLNILKKNIQLKIKFKSYRIFKKDIEKNYIEVFDFFLCIGISIINNNSFNTQLFVDSTKKMIEKISNETNKEKIHKTNQTTIHLMIYTLKKSMFLLNYNTSSHLFCYNLSLVSLSQTYLFYKFSKIQVLNLYKFRYILPYYGTLFFIKNQMKDFFVKKGIFHFDSKKKKLKSKKKQWRFWFFKTHYQYDLSPIRWFRLSRKVQRHRIVNQYCTVLYFLINKCNLSHNEKVQFIFYYYKKKKDYEEFSLSNKKDYLKKNDLNPISYKFLNYEYENITYLKKRSSLINIKLKKEIKNYNYNSHKRKLLDLLKILYHFLGENEIKDIDKYLNFYINCSIQFFLKKKIIVPLSNINNTNNSYPLLITDRTGINNRIMDLIFNKKNISYFTIYKKNEERLKNYPRLNTLNTLWFFPEFFLFYNEYKMKPWVIPIELLILHLNENFSLTKKIYNLSSNEKKDFLNLKSRNKKKEWNERENISDIQNQDSILPNQLKWIKDLYVKSNRQKKLQKKQYKNHIETELDLLLKNYFFFQLRWDKTLNLKIINNIKVYCLLLRLINPKYMILSSIQRREISLNIMLNKDIFIKELIKSGILIIEPFRLSVKKNKKFILVYQIVSFFLLIKKSKNQQINQKYQEKKNVDLIFNEFKSIEQHQKVFGTKEKNKNIYNIYFIPENMFSTRRNRELRIRISLYSRNFFKNKKLNQKDRNQFNKLKQLKLFLWTNYQLEDLIYVNRYWFNTYNGSRFSLLRICK